MQRPDRSRFESPRPAAGVVAAGVVVAAALALLVVTGCSERSDSVDTVYRVLVEQCTGVDNQRATAVAVAPDLLVTVAHSFDEAKSISVTDVQGENIPARLVYLDPGKDIAVLEAETDLAAVLSLAGPEETGMVTITTFADVEGPEAKEAEILELVDATLDGQGRRAAIRLAAEVEPGDSGAPVVDRDGRMVGMVFATARATRVGWAVSSDEIADAVEQLNANRPEGLPLTC